MGCRIDQNIGQSRGGCIFVQYDHQSSSLGYKKRQFGLVLNSFGRDVALIFSFAFVGLLSPYGWHSLC
jgi:hypothetical protein